MKNCAFCAEIRKAAEEEAKYVKGGQETLDEATERIMARFAQYLVELRNRAGED